MKSFTPRPEEPSPQTVRRLVKLHHNAVVDLPGTPFHTTDIERLRRSMYESALKRKAASTLTSGVEP